MRNVNDDPFAVLGMERCWAVDLQRIRATQSRLLATHHPDRHPLGVAQDEAVAQSARVNRAVAVLSDPLQRAEALIRLGDAGGAAVALPQQILLEMLSRRDGLTEATTHEDVAQCRAWIACERRAQEEAIGAVFSSASVDWLAARRLLAHLRALVRLDEDALRVLAKQGRKPC
jgi:Fe-S protein assembly co-chaperone HscB